MDPRARCAVAHQVRRLLATAIVGPDMAGKDKKTYGWGSSLVPFLLLWRSGSNSNKQPPRLVA
jgi:hypothetical protein